MKQFLVFLLLSLLSAMVYPQHYLVLKSGEVINCKITDIDITWVYYATTIKDDTVKQLIRKSEVVVYGFNQNNHVQRKHVWTIGVLQGGGSKVGADFEFLISKRFALQAGAGIAGFG